MADHDDDKPRRSQNKLLQMAKRLGVDKLRKMIEEGSGRFNDRQLRLFRTLLGVLKGGKKKEEAA